MNERGHLFRMQIRPRLPKELERLEELAGDLWFSWNARFRMLFHHIDPVLWEMCNHNPRLFLRRVSQYRLDEVAQDRAFIALFNGVLSDYDSYHKQGNQWFPMHYENEKDFHVAYFSAEFGLHESLPIYSGGLGILAGDHCKSASDLGLPFTAVGLLYRHGYFHQIIDAQGNQVAVYPDNPFEDLCIEPVLDEHGKEKHVTVLIEGAPLQLKIWKAKAGHIQMLLLDADIEANHPEQRKITYELYGGDLQNRIRQEICLGIGGVRALRACGINPSVWHINEGHAAFAILERLREYVQEKGLDFDAALEVTAASTIFTTHTPVPAGHDIFPEDLFLRHIGKFIDYLGISKETLLELGRGDLGLGGEGFNQTVLAIRGSAYQNGVSRLHSKVTSHMCRSMWPDIPPEENPMSSVTNGVHAPSWLASEWIAAFDQHLGGQWRGRLQHADFWERVNDIPDYLFWSIHQTNKNRMLQYVRELLQRQAKRNGESMQLVQEMTAQFDVRHLVIGFARRFATYKRATLLFHDEQRLLQILEEVGKPVIFLFAGKAHPADRPGQELIRRIHQISRRPEFIGKVIMLEGYDMTLARYLTSGVDVWLNNPRRPLEASGTSGMKAAMNGVPNLSVLDGWWPEGFQGDNGWVIGGERDVGDEALRDADDAASLYHVLRYDVIPTYYDRSESGYSPEWVRICKRAMVSTIPRFNTDRMVAEYCDRFYMPAAHEGWRMEAEGFARAKAFAAWKKKVREAWPNLKLEGVGEMPQDRCWYYGEQVPLRVKAHLNGLSPDDVRVELVILRPSREGGYKRYAVFGMDHVGEGVFECEINPGDTGNFAYQVRMYPKHEDLPHPFAMGLMTWL